MGSRGRAEQHSAVFPFTGSHAAASLALVLTLLSLLLWLSRCCLCCSGFHAAVSVALAFTLLCVSHAAVSLPASIMDLYGEPPTGTQSNWHPSWTLALQHRECLALRWKSQCQTNAHTLMSTFSTLSYVWLDATNGLTRTQRYMDTKSVVVLANLVSLHTTHSEFVCAIGRPAVAAMMVRGFSIAAAADELSDCCSIIRDSEKMTVKQ